MRLKLSLCLLLILSFTVNNIEAQNSTYTVSGIVLDSISNKPLLGVYVTNGREGGQTNAKGEYAIKNVAVGESTFMTMYYSNYSQQSKEVNIQGNTKIDFSLNDNIIVDEVVVTGTRTPRRLSDTPIQTTVISEQSISASVSTTALESLMDNVPGITGSQNQMGANLRYKGLTSRYILFLVDGERMVSEGASGNINLNQIDVNNIKRIEMVDGAASALYGSNAVGAVINIITKEPVHKFEAGAGIIGETNNTLRVNVDAGMNLEKVKVSMGAFRNSSDGFAYNNGESNAVPYEDYGANLKLIYKPIERADITFTGRYFSHETFNLDDPKIISVKHGYTQNLNFGVSGGLKSRDERNNLRVSFNYNKFTKFNILEKMNDKKEESDNASYISTRILNSFSPNEKWEIVAGIEHNNESNFAETTLGKEPTTKSIDDINIFAQAEYEVIRNFDIIAGARYAYNSQFGSAFTPKVSLMYELGNFKFRGGIGSAFRAPSIKELYYDFNHQGMFFIYGNPNLKAEKGLYTSFSTEFSKNLFNASVSLYYNDISNKITQYTIQGEGNNLPETHYKNVSSATLKGFDINVSQTLFRELTIRANYSFCDAIDNSTSEQIDDNLKHSATISATWNGTIAKSPFSLQISGNVSSPKFYTQNDQIIETDPYSIWKIAVVKPIRINKHTIEVTAKVDNVFGFKSPIYVNSGRMYLVGIRYRFK